MYKRASKNMQGWKEMALRPSLGCKNHYGAPLYKREVPHPRVEPAVIFLSEQESVKYRQRIQSEKENRLDKPCKNDRSVVVGKLSSVKHRRINSVISEKLKNLFPKGFRTG
jgi:hypothetical protein